MKTGTLSRRTQFFSTHRLVEADEERVLKGIEKAIQKNIAGMSTDHIEGNARSGRTCASGQG